MQKSLLTLLSLALASSSMAAEITYVTARPSPCTVTANCPGPNTDGTYTEQWPLLGDYGAVGSAPGHPPTTVARTYISSAAVTDPSYGVILTPTLPTPGAVYQIDYNFNSTAGNTSTNIILSVTCTSGGTLSFSETDKFQRRFGNPANQWQLLGYLTNDPGSATPTIEFRYKSGEVSGSTQNRLLFDCWRFTKVEPCLAVPVVSVVGPISSSTPEVIVAGVAADATGVTVYQDTGSGMVQIGTRTSGVTAGNNTVTVAGLVKNSQVAATQTINGQEGCVPVQGTRVGGGANPSVRVALTIRETTNITATIGAAGNTSSGNLHFLGASTVTGTAPVDAPIVYPSNGWQTVTFSRDAELAGTPTNLAGAILTPPGGFNYYFANDSVKIKVYAFRTVQPENQVIYSAVAPESTAFTSNNYFGVRWSWDAVPGAEGYRILRNINGNGYNEGTDVTSTTLVDTNDYAIWIAGTTVTPNIVQRGPSVQWNPSVGSVSNLPGIWGTLESINFVIQGGDSGPYDLYIDNIKNGDTVFQTFEEAPANTTDYGFRAPRFSGTTSANLLGEPNVGVVSNGAADTGTKAFRVRFQFVNTNETRWLRLTTFQANPVRDPFVNLNLPISFRLLLQPVGATLPAPPAPPTISASISGAETILNWTGGHRLQTAVDVSGTYTNVPQTINPNTFLGPWTNTFTEPTRFFRLLD